MIQYYIPSYVLEKIAQSDDIKAQEIAKNSLIQSKNAREMRNANAKRISTATVMGIAAREVTHHPPGKSAREVHDNLHKWEFHDNLVRSEGNAAVEDKIVNEVYDHTGIFRDFLKNSLNLESIDNLGMNLPLYVHFGENYANAFWDGKRMAFGDGDGDIFTDFGKSLDVIAHEIGHGITQYNGNLIYESQSGALNEHFSDVFGAIITQKAKNQSADKADWLVGNEIMGPKLYGEALRCMREPGTAYDNDLMGVDIQPGHMKDYFSGPEDNQGVHINSGIPNKAFYLASIGLETENAAKIWFHALQNLWPEARFNDAVKRIALSARLLAREGIVEAGAPQVVRSAFKEVGLPTP